MRYYKVIHDGCISCIGTVDTDRAVAGEISKSEYNSLMELISGRPEAPDGYQYRLSQELAWVLVEAEPEPEVVMWT